MNAPEKISQSITLRIGDATVTVPAELAAMAYIEQVLISRPLRLEAPAQADSVPPIGADYAGGKVAGLTIFDNAPRILVLLEGENESCTWQEAKAWAKEIGGELPTRFDQLVLFKNMKGEFQEAWYWSGEQHAGNESSAWGQGFSSGGQYWDHVSNHGRARAVRRLPIQ